METFTPASPEVEALVMQTALHHPRRHILWDLFRQGLILKLKKIPPYETTILTELGFKSDGLVLNVRTTSLGQHSGNFLQVALQGVPLTDTPEGRYEFRIIWRTDAQTIVNQGHILTFWGHFLLFRRAWRTDAWVRLGFIGKNLKLVVFEQ